MLLAPTAFDTLAARCAPAVAVQTLRAVARVESGFDPWVIGVNGQAPYRVHPPTMEAAVRAARALIAAGANVDLGLLQINSKTLGSLGLSVAAAFQPCENVRAAGRLLQANYALGAPARVGEQAALRIALSYYNTGRPDRGFRNGYVARVTGAPTPSVTPASRSITKPPPPPAWEVFSTPSPATVFVTASTASGGFR